MSTKTLTIGEVRAWIEGHGLTYASIAKQMNVDRSELNQAMNGRVQWRRGNGHRIAVSLRVKVAPQDFDGKFVLPPVATVRRWLRDNEIEPIPHPRQAKEPTQTRQSA